LNGIDGSRGSQGQRASGSDRLRVPGIELEDSIEHLLDPGPPTTYTYAQAVRWMDFVSEILVRNHTNLVLSAFMCRYPFLVEELIDQFKCNIWDRAISGVACCTGLL
jgi:hypothetical protein